MSDFDPPMTAVRTAVRMALDEDLLPAGDITASLVPEEQRASAAFVARDRGVLAGSACVVQTLAEVDASLTLDWRLSDGHLLAPGEVIGVVEGRLRSILTAERTALNFLCHLSGVATSTSRHVEEARKGHPDARVWDTRKTTPGLRALEKAAVRAGGAVNHRGNLSEGVLVKDNHLAGISISEAVRTARRRWPGRMVEVECDRLDQVGEAVAAGATIVMCDNMSPAEVEAAVELVRRQNASTQVLVEASGGIDLTNIAGYAAAGADLISVGAMTHSAPILDIGLDIAVDLDSNLGPDGDALDR